MTGPIRVLLADDHEILRQGLKALFETVADIDVVSDVEDGARAIDAVQTLSPDLVIMALSLPTNGLLTIRRIKEQRPRTTVIVLTRHRDAAYVREAFAVGASGYVLKQGSFSELLAAVKTVMNGELFVDPRLPAVVDLRGPTALHGIDRQLTGRELAVLRFAAQGRTNKDIAVEYGISVKTVEVHKANAMRKLQLEDRGDLLRYALIQGWM